MTTRPHRSGRARAAVAVVVAAVVAVAPLSASAQAAPDECTASSTLAAGAVAPCTGILTAPADALRDAKAYDERDEARALLGACRGNAAEWERLARERDGGLRATAAKLDAANTDADSARASRSWWAVGGAVVGAGIVVAVVWGFAKATGRSSGAERAEPLAEALR